MAYLALTTAEIAIGGPVQNPTLTTIKGDLDYFKTTTDSLNSALQNPEPLTFDLHGNWWIDPVQTGIAYKRIWTSISLTGGILWVPKQGTAGTFTADVLYKRGAGAYTSIFSVQPSVAYNAAAPDHQASTNGALTSTPLLLLSGDFLRVDISTAQTGSNEFHVLLPYTFT